VRIFREWGGFSFKKNIFFYFIKIFFFIFFYFIKKIFKTADDKQADHPRQNENPRALLFL